MQQIYTEICEVCDAQDHFKKQFLFFSCFNTFHSNTKWIELTWQDDPGADRCQTPRRPLQLTETNKASPAPGPADGTKKKTNVKTHKSWHVISEVFHFLVYNSLCQHAHLVCCSFMLCYPLCVLAALRGRELSDSDLTVTSAHGQGGVSAVRQELCLLEPKSKKKTHISHMQIIILL